VETVDHLRMVTAAGCDFAQGWLLGRPMPADDVPTWVARFEAGGDLSFPGRLPANVAAEPVAGPLLHGG
jgi:predicted signal transduction protein with EAL and GGDEF domain